MLIEISRYYNGTLDITIYIPDTRYHQLVDEIIISIKNISENEILM